MPWEAIPGTVAPVSAMDYNRLCFFPAPELEMITSSKLRDAIGLCYLTTLP